MVEAGYVTWPGGELVRAGMRYRIPGGPHAGGVAEVTGESTPGGLYRVRFPGGSVVAMRPAFILEAVRASAELELDAAGITSDAATRGVLVARIMRGETTAEELAEILERDAAAREP